MPQKFRQHPTLPQGFSHTFEKRFWFWVKKTNTCWLWIGSRDSRGYGIISRGAQTGKRLERSHRASWIIHFGPVPESICVLHRCDTPACVNPSHLFLGTLSDNSRDMVSKGRNFQNQGEKNPRSKFTWEQVREIRRLLASGEASQSELCRRFHAGDGWMSDVAHGRLWKERHAVSIESISRPHPPTWSLRRLAAFSGPYFISTSSGP